MQLNTLHSPNNQIGDKKGLHKFYYLEKGGTMLDLFVEENCPYCKKVIDYFKENNIPFTPMISKTKRAYNKQK